MGSCQPAMQPLSKSATRGTASIFTDASTGIYERLRGIPGEENYGCTTIPPMTQQTGGNKSAALNELYDRVVRIAEAMGGDAVRRVTRLSLPNAMTATPRGEDAPTLHVQMPNGFEVDITPADALSVGNALSVHVKRTHDGLRKSDWRFNYGPNGWRRTQNPLSDDEIGACLTPEGPKPARY